MPYIQSLFSPTPAPFPPFFLFQPPFPHYNSTSPRSNPILSTLTAFSPTLPIPTIHLYSNSIPFPPFQLHAFLSDFPHSSAIPSIPSPIPTPTPATFHSIPAPPRIFQPHSPHPYPASPPPDPARTVARGPLRLLGAAAHGPEHPEAEAGARRQPQRHPQPGPGPGRLRHRHRHGRSGRTALPAARRDDVTERRQWCGGGGALGA